MGHFSNHLRIARNRGRRVPEYIKALFGLLFSLALFAGCSGLTNGHKSGAQEKPSAEMSGPPSRDMDAFTGPKNHLLADAAPGALDGKARYNKPSAQVLKVRLTAIEFEVTQRGATEPPFANAYYNNHNDGIYVDVATGEPLFSSRDKFDSGTGWPSFTKPIEAGRVQAKPDDSLGMHRTEVFSSAGQSHLGHVFEDGPAPTGLRYCINSSALRFVPKGELTEGGYSRFAAQFGLSATSAPPSSSTGNSCALPPPGVKPGCSSTLQTAVLAGGCFWGMQEILRKVPGVLETQVGYAGGSMNHPTYEAVSTGTTGHAEAVRIVFDPKLLSFSDLLEKWFFRMHDPTTTNRQHNDVGSQYRSAIFYQDDEQRKTAQYVIAKVNASGRWKAPLVTEVTQAGPFTAAEEYHQDYLEKHPDGYTCHYLRD